MAIVDVNTKLVGLLGNPLGHSFSPPMHNRAFDKLGLNFFYLPIEVTDEHLKDVARGISRMNFAGYNITIPHKIGIMEHLDHIDELARGIGAVNTVTIDSGITTGHNTDGLGYVVSLESEADISIAGKTCFVIGCGGAARAIVMTLAFRNVGKIFLCNRTEQKAHDLCVEINAKVRHCCEVVPFMPAVIEPVIGRADVLINATSVGMHPDEDKMVIDAGLIPAGIVVSDIVYNPLKTKLLRAAEERGCRTVGGLGMLVYQGAEAFRMWTGVEPPVTEMFDVVRALKS